MYLDTIRRRTVAAAVAAVTSIPLCALIPASGMAGVPGSGSSDPVGASSFDSERSSGLRFAKNDGN